ncbi:MAG TPA: ATP-binding protein [Acidimicrobiia bacterium]
MSILLFRSKRTGSIAALLHSTRVSGAAVATAFFAIMAVVWRWPAGALVTGLAALGLIHSVWRRRQPERVSMDVFMFDATAIAAMVLIIQPPMIILVAPATSIIVAAVLTLSSRRAAIAIGYSVVLLIAAGAVVTVYSDRTWSTFETIILTAGVALVFLPHMAPLLRQAARGEVERDESTARLAEREARYRSLVEGLPVGVYRTAVDGTILEVNEALVEMLRYPDRGSLLGLNVTDIYTEPVIRDHWLSAVADGGTGRDQPLSLQRSDGSIIWVRDAGTSSRNESGEIVHYEGTLEDVTEAVRLASYEHAIAACADALLTEAPAEAVRRSLNAVLEAAAVDVVFIDRNVEDPELGLCTDIVYQVGSEVTPDDAPWHMVPWSTMPLALEHLARGDHFAFEVDDLAGPERKAYEDSPMRSEVEVPVFHEGEWLGVVGFGDYTGARTWAEHEVALLRTLARLIASAWDRQNQSDRLEQLVKSRDDFIASVSHRLRTPLTAVVGASSLLREGGSLRDDEREELIDDLAEQSLEVANVVEDLLIAARADIGTMRLSLRSVDLRSAVESAIGSLPEASRSGITIEGPAVAAWADQHRVRQVVRHLLDNAQRYGEGSVAVTLSNGADRVRVAVADDGPGLPANHARFFEPFESIDFGLPPGQLGIGLSIAQRLAAMMDGALTYRRIDNLSEFSLDLPRA